MKDLALKQFGISAICLQLIAVATDYILVCQHLNGLSHLSRLLPMMFLAISVPIAVTGLTRDRKRYVAIIACVLLWPIIALIGGLHGIS